jgi:hypothetical protein
LIQEDGDDDRPQIVAADGFFPFTWSVFPDASAGDGCGGPAVHDAGVIYVRDEDESTHDTGDEIIRRISLREMVIDEIESHLNYVTGSIDDPEGLQVIRGLRAMFAEQIAMIDLALAGNYKRKGKDNGS